MPWLLWQRYINTHCGQDQSIPAEMGQSNATDALTPCIDSSHFDMIGQINISLRFITKCDYAKGSIMTLRKFPHTYDLLYILAI